MLALHCLVGTVTCWYAMCDKVHRTCQFAHSVWPNELREKAPHKWALADSSLEKCIAVVSQRNPRLKCTDKKQGFGSTHINIGHKMEVSFVDTVQRTVKTIYICRALQWYSLCDLAIAWKTAVCRHNYLLERLLLHTAIRWTDRSHMQSHLYFFYIKHTFLLMGKTVM